MDLAKIINPSAHDVTLPTNHIVPAKGALTVDDAVLHCADNAPFLSGQVLSGALTIEPDVPEPVDAPAPNPPVSPKNTPKPADDDAGNAKKG